MFFLFLKEKAAWILFIILLLFGINILFYLDSGLSNISVGYFNLVTCSLFIAFFLWRYFKESRELVNFLGNLSNRSDLLFLERLTLSPYKRKLLESFLESMNEKEMQINDAKVQIQEHTEDFLAWVHEMKTPLTAMKLMIEQTDDFALRKKLENEWIRIHLLLDQQLHNTRLATIEKDNRLEKVILRNVVYNEIREFQSWCMEKGLGFDIEELEQEVITDKKWLSFILRQLLSNAIKYSYENNEIRIFTEKDSTGHILLHIQDYGIGIKQEDLPRIFSKSYTGTIGRESVQSTGMGLYLARNAAQKLGIQIIVQSNVNKGSTFTLQFPTRNEYINTLGR